MSTIVSEVNIVPMKPKNGLIALASCVIDGKFFIGSLGVYTNLRRGGYRITYPTKKVGERSVDLCHPINRETYDAIEKAISEHLEVLLDSDKIVYEDKDVNYESVHTK